MPKAKLPKEEIFLPRATAMINNLARDIHNNLRACPCTSPTPQDRQLAKSLFKLGYFKREEDDDPAETEQRPPATVAEARARAENFLGPVDPMTENLPVETQIFLTHPPDAKIVSELLDEQGEKITPRPNPSDPSSYGDTPFHEQDYAPIPGGILSLSPEATVGPTPEGVLAALGFAGEVLSATTENREGDGMRPKYNIAQRLMAADIITRSYYHKR